MWSAVLRCCGATVLRCYGAGAGGYVGNQKSAKKGGPLVEFGGAPSLSAFFFFSAICFFFLGDIKYAVVFGDKSRKSAFSAIAYGVRAYILYRVG